MPSIWDVFRVPPPGELPSAAPGAGPYAHDTATNSADVGVQPRGIGRGSPDVPPTAMPNQTGYGGGGDSVRVVADPTGQGIPAHGGNQTKRARTLADLLNRNPPGPAVPRYNKLYDSQRSCDGVGVFNDGYAVGTITPVAGPPSATATVTLNQQIVGGILARVSQYPGGIALYLGVRMFSAAPQTTAETGNVSFVFQDAFGSAPIALGVAAGNDEISGVGLPAFGNSPITDAGLNGGNLGTLTVNVGGAIGTAAIFNWVMNFSFVYILPDPAFSGYRNLLPSVDEEMQKQALYAMRRG